MIDIGRLLVEYNRSIKIYNKVDISFKFSNRKSEITEWLDSDNTNGSYIWDKLDNPSMILFEFEEDAVLFKLTFF